MRAKVPFALSVLLNLALIGAMVNTYIHNIYFQLWADSLAAPVIGMISLASASIGLFVGIVFLYEKISRPASKVIRRHLTPLELIELRNPNLVTNGAEDL